MYFMYLPAETFLNTFSKIRSGLGAILQISVPLLNRPFGLEGLHLHIHSPNEKEFDVVNGHDIKK